MFNPHFKTVAAACPTHAFQWGLLQIYLALQTAIITS
jgi:hypothetical protein